MSPACPELLSRNLETGRLRFTTQAEDAMADAEIAAARTQRLRV
jgi:hypothetical protein